MKDENGEENKGRKQAAERKCGVRRRGIEGRGIESKANEITKRQREKVRWQTKAEGGRKGGRGTECEERQ